VRTYTLLRNVCGPSDRRPSACHPAGSLIKSNRGKRVAAYHCTAKIVSRSRGQSAIAKAAYNARDRLVDEKTGELKNYSRNEDQVLFSGIFAPKDAPAWAQDREQLWNQAEAAEKRKDAQLAREIEVALPHELTQQQREWLIKDFVRENFTRAGMVADVNMHEPSREGDERNIHAHILLTTRAIDADGFGPKARDWNDKALLEKWREDYAEKGAKMLERAGFETEAQRFRHGHLTLPEQREKALERGDLEFAESIDRAPTKHKGPQICEMERRGEVSFVQEHRSEEAANDNQHRSQLTALRKELAGVEKQIERSEKAFPKPEKELSETAANIRLSYGLTHTPNEFREALADHGLFLAKVSKRDEIEQTYGEEKLGYDFDAPIMPPKEESQKNWTRWHHAEDDFVVMDSRGYVYALTKHNTGETAKEVQNYLGTLDTTTIKDIATTRETLAQAREAAYEPRVAIERDATPSGIIAENQSGQEAEAVQIEKAAGLAFDATAEVIGKSTDFVADSFGSLFDTQPKQPSLDDMYRAQERAEAKEQRAQEEDLKKGQVDFARYVSDQDYRFQVMKHQAEEREEQRKREESYEQHFGRERERDRDRER
jgi:hypothetical protein